MLPLTTFVTLYLIEPKRTQREILEGAFGGVGFSFFPFTLFVRLQCNGMKA